MKRLLVLDEDTFVIKMMEDIFGKQWTILQETFKERIPERFAEDPPDLILLNCALRRTEGEPTFDLIRNVLPNTPVIVCSPSNMAKTGRDMVKRGAFWNLTTPLNTSDLENVLKIAFQLDEYRQQAMATHRDFSQLEQGIARLSIPTHGTPIHSFSFELDDMTQRIIDLLADILQVERVSLMLLDPATNEL